MEIKVNGEVRALDAPATLREFLMGLNLPSLERGLAVCINGEVVRKADWEHRRINADDELEIVHATQGG